MEIVGMNATKLSAIKCRFIDIDKSEVVIAEYASYVIAKYPQQSAKPGAIGG